MRRSVPYVLALLAGLLLAAATPPWGFWIAAFFGIALLDHVLDGTTGWARFGRAWLVWAALLYPTIFWMRAMTLPGYVIAAAAYAGFLAAGTLLAPTGPGRFVALPGGIMLAEWVRWRWPFGGVPLSNLAIGQVAGPLAPMLRVGGALFVVGMTVTVGCVLAAAWKRQPRIALALAAFTAVVLGVAIVAPDGNPTGERLDVALVQGGGPQGTRADETDPSVVFQRHIDASNQIDSGHDLDLVIWPEDVVDVATLRGSAEDRQLRNLARRLHTTLIVGVVEDEGADAFHNWAVVYDPAGDELDRYEKVERVPFGEWVPMRSIIEPLSGGSVPDRDALIGQEPAVVHTEHGTLGVMISWEVFFGERARDAATHGAEVLLNPTNGSSFEGTQVQTQQVASSRMRAIENGRWVTQVAPTGFSAVVTPDGDVRQRTAVSEQRVLYDTIELRTGETIYARLGDDLALVYAAACLAVGWALDRRWGDRTAERSDDDMASVAP